MEYPFSMQMVSLSRRTISTPRRFASSAVIFPRTVDGVEDLDAVAFLDKSVSDFKDSGALGEDVVKIFRGNIFRIFASKIGGFNIIQHQTLHFVLQSVFCGPAEVNTYHIGGILNLHAERTCGGRLRCGQSLCFLIHVCIPPLKSPNKKALFLGRKGFRYAIMFL